MATRARAVGGVIVAAGLLASVACEHRVGREVPPGKLSADFGPEWAVVEDYSAAQSSGSASDGALLEATSRPDASHAIAAALAILEAGGAHAKTVEAAEFLILQVDLDGDGEADQHVAAGARALLQYAPGYGRWPKVLNRLHHRRALGPASMRSSRTWRPEPETRRCAPRASTTSRPGSCVPRTRCWAPPPTRKTCDNAPSRQPPD